MSLSALLCANRGDISTWTAETMDRVLAVENSMFLKAFEERSIPDEETISLDYLPDRVRHMKNRPTRQTIKINHLKHLLLSQQNRSTIYADLNVAF